MNHADAVALIRDGVIGHPGTWADLGAGSGTFTRALAELLGNSGHIYSVDQDIHAVERVAAWARSAGPQVSAVHADFTRDLTLPGLTGLLDGILLANALHFVPDASGVLSRLTTLLRPGGRVILVEYDRREASRWVPYPIGIARLPALAEAAGLSEPRVLATRPSEYAGILYASSMDRSP